MAAVQKLALGQNFNNLVHGRGGKVGEKKEEVKENPFWCLPTETHHGGQNRNWKGAALVCS